MCKKKSVKSCLPKSYSDYEVAVKPFLKIVQSDTAKPNKKRQASEEIGTLAAIKFNADRHGMTFSASKKAHTEFRGCGVPDLTMQVGKTLEIKEAKGGSSGYGTRRDINGKKRVTQCTPRYTSVIAHKMKHSNYKGRHPDVACSKHKKTGSPVGSCSDCKKAERDRRRHMGVLMEQGIQKRRILKIAVRGNYTKTCLRKPEAIEAYGLDKNGGKKMISV